MEVGMRSGSGGVLVKKKSSGCLIVRKKGNDVVGAASGVGSSSTSRKLNAFNKRRFTDSGSSDSSLMPPSIRVCNGRKRDILEQIRGSGEGLIAENDLDKREMKRNKLDFFNLNEHDAMDVEKMRMRHFDNNGVGFGGGRFIGSMHAARIGMDREFETGSNRYILDKMKNSYYDGTSGLYPGDNVECSRFKMNRDGARLPPPLLREKINSDEYIRIQGKNGVLKVMVNKKKVGGGPLEHYDHRKRVESRQRLRTEGFADKNVLIHPSPYLETKPAEKPGLPVRPEKKQIASKKSFSSKDVKGEEWDSDNSDTSLNPGIKSNEVRKSEKKIISEDEQRNTEPCKFEKRIISENEQTPMHEKLPTSTIKEGKIRHGSATERQKLRERIREMLLNAGWTIDYRPRRNRDYLDAVYINTAGTAYWSIIKAYEAFQKQLNDDVDETKPKGDGSSFAPIADEVLSQLTRKTRKKMEKELKKNKKKKYDTEIESGKEPRIIRSARNKHDMNSMDTDSNGEKLSSFVKQGSNSMKNKMIENAIVNASSKSQNATHHSNDGKEKSFFGCVPHHIHGRKSKNYGRCTLLVRSSNKGLNSESDGFVPYTGKRTVLSWLIDSGTVGLSQKVQYRRWKKVLLEGWITRDGVHCGCCSKILTVSKFELHAGSKLTQPYQNIYLESGVSLLQCLIDAWNRQENSDKIGFHSVDMDGDDPNDDACGICGDGGDLICCDSCPSTFHQSCLNIQMLPPGEWHCPNCTCKFCGKAGGTFRKDDATMYALRTCNLCEKKYHDSCTKEIDALPNNLNTSGPSFCGKECKELLEHLKKFIGFKHELEAGFSWSLIHRTDEGSEAANRGIAHRVECNSKLAIALTVMDECFLPVVDRRSGINLIRNVLHNSGSNFSRLSYCGFYTAILERGDEIISVASLRFHGTKLAEMPFIGTRHIYRRQGMCRRLFSAIESALCCLKVEKLVIPLITELMHTWKAIFGFTHLEESLRQEVRSLNMLVFPGIDMLQKLLVEQEKHKGNTTAAGSKKTGNGDVLIKTKMASTVIDSSILQDPHGSDDASSNPANEMNQFSDASQEPNNQSMVDGSMCSKSHFEERLSDSVSDKCVSPSSTSHGALGMKDKIANAPPVDGKLNPSPSVSPTDNSVTSHPLDVPDCDKIPTLVQETACSDCGSAENLDRKCHLFTATNCDSSELDINPVLDSQVADNTLSSKEIHMNDGHGVLEAVPSGNLSEENITKENKENVDVSGSVLNHADESLLQVRSDFNGEIAYEGEKNLHSNTEVASGDSSETDPD